MRSICALLLLLCASLGLTVDLVPTVSFTDSTKANYPLAVALPDKGLILAGQKDQECVVSRFDLNGNHIWTAKVPSEWPRDMDVADGCVYVYTTGRVLRFGIEDGALAWSAALPGEFLDMAPSVNGGVLVATKGISLHYVSLDGDAETLYTNYLLDTAEDRAKIVSEDETYLISEHLGYSYDKLIRVGADGNPLWTRAWPTVGYTSQYVEALGALMGDTIPVDRTQRAEQQRTRTYDFLNRETGADVKSVLITLNQGSNQQYAAVTPGAEFYYRVLGKRIYQYPNPIYSPTEVTRTSYSGQEFWKSQEPAIEPVQAFIHRNELWWIGRAFVAPYASTIERVTYSGQRAGSAAIGILYGPAVFLPTGNSLWVVTNRSGGFVASRYETTIKANRDDYQAEEGQQLTVDAAHGVLANDELAETAEVVLESQPLHGQVQLNTDGSFVYTPQAGFRGYDDIRYHFVREGESSNSAIAGVAVGTFVMKHLITPAETTGGNSATGRVYLNRKAGSGGLTTTLRSTSSLIQSPPSVTVAQDQTEASYEILTKGVNEGVERHVIAEGSVPYYAPLRLLKARLATLSINPQTVAGGTPAVGTVGLDGKAGPAGAAVQLSDNSSAITVPASVNVAANVATATFTVGTNAVSTAFTRQVYASYGGVQKVFNLVIRPPQLQSLQLSASSIPGGNSVTATVKFDGKVAAATNYSASVDNFAITAPSSATVPAGSNTSLFTIGTSAVVDYVTATITVNHNGISKTASLTVVPAKFSSLSISPTSVQGGKPATGTVRFDGKVAQHSAVALSSNSGSIIVPAGVSVNAGFSSATFSITTKPVTSAATRQVSASFAGVTKTATLTLTP